jgi:required for meiotic nuclear division protein 1
MQVYELKSAYISAEIDLNKIATHFGINKKFKWEEPLVFSEDLLKGVIPHPQNKFAYIFHYGSIVSINLTHHEVQDIISYLKKIDINLKNNNLSTYIEDFKLEVNDKKDLELNYNSIVVKSFKRYYVDMIATVLAKSVALEKIEDDTDILLDEIEDVIEFLEKGHLNLSDEKLAKMSARVLKFKYSSISYIMLLEKPDIAWENEEAQEFFTHLSELFELKDRYEKIRHKTEVLLDITEVFSGLTHAKRGTRLEWMVILLILAEIIMSLLEKIFHI